MNHIEKYYSELIESNPIFFIYNQLYKSVFDIPSILDKVNFIVPEKYTSKNSFLYQYNTDELFDIDQNGKFYFSNYKIIICICDSVNKNSLEDRTLFDQDDSLVDYNLYSDFFEKKNFTIKISDGKKCEKTCDLKKNKTWCTNCHGNFDDVSNFNLIMNRALEFNKIPKKSIIYIEKNTHQIDVENKNDSNKLKIFLESEMNEINTLKELKDNHLKELEDTIQQMKLNNEKTTKKLETILNKYGGSIEKFKKFLDHNSHLLQQ